MAIAVKNGKNRQAETRRAAQMMKRIMIHFRSQMDEKLRPEGVTTAQLHMLKVIRDEPCGSGAQLARAFLVSVDEAGTYAVKFSAKRGAADIDRLKKLGTPPKDLVTPAIWGAHSYIFIE